MDAKLRKEIDDAQNELTRLHRTSLDWNNMHGACGCALTRKYYRILPIKNKETKDLYADIGRFVAENSRLFEMRAHSHGDNTYGALTYEFIDHDNCRIISFDLNWCGEYDSERGVNVWHYFWTLPDCKALYHCVNDKEQLPFTTEN